MAVSFVINTSGGEPLYKQLLQQFESKIKTGKLKSGDMVPSMNDLANQLNVSRETIKKVYSILRDRGYLEPRQGKGFYVKEQNSLRNLSILILFDKLSIYKQTILNSFLAEVGDGIETTFLIFNQNLDLLEYYLDLYLDQFDYYLVTPHCPLDEKSQKRMLKIISRIPNRKLIVLDVLPKNLRGNFGAVYQDFENDAYDGLAEGLDKIKIIGRLKVITLPTSLYGKQVIKAVDRFCEENGIVAMYYDAPPKKIYKNDIFLLISSQLDTGIAELNDNVISNNLTIGKDVFLISYNEFDLNKVVLGGLTTISTDFAKMGRLAAKMVKEKKFSWETLERDVLSLIDRHLQFDEEEFAHIAARNHSASLLPFPYAHFRPGQREMAKYIYALMSKKQSKNVFFFEAPTGIGKTISAIYPALKSFAKGTNSKLFYLTAKGSGRQAAFDALSSCYEKGFVGRDSWLVAKDKICFQPGSECNPDSCPFAKDYYGKLRQVTKEEVHENHRYSPEFVTTLARHYAMCPFELQLDLSLLADVILCDYNYFFDPLVRLDRYFGPEADPSRDIVLIDEAHNLPSRARDMYSESLSLSLLEKVKKDLSEYKTFRSIKNARKKLQTALEEVEKAQTKPFAILPSFPDSVFAALFRRRSWYI